MLNFLRAHKLAVVLIVAAAARLAVLLLLSSTLDFAQSGEIHGSSAYDTYAQNLLATGVYGKLIPGVPDAHLPPLYSYVLARLYAVFGRGYLQVGVFHILLDLASITCLYHLCKRLFPSPMGANIGALAGIFYALYPYLIFQNLTLIDTPLFMALLYAFLLVMALLRERPQFDRAAWAYALVGGLVLGITLLARANILIVIVAVAVWFTFRRGLLDTIRALLPVGLVAAMCITPWIIRNYQVFDTFVPFSLNSGENIYQGNNEYTMPYLRAGYDVQWVPLEGLEFEGDDVFGPQANNARTERGLTYLREHPEAIPELLWTKFLVYWSIDVAPRFNPTEGELPRLDYQGNVITESDDSEALELGGLPPGDPVGTYSTPLFDQIGRALHRIYFGGLLALALIGIVLSRKLWRDVSLLWFTQISMTLVYVAFHPSTRYRVPTDPLLFAFSAFALMWIWGSLRSRTSSRKVTNEQLAQT